jgi:hypothetical protein
LIGPDIYKDVQLSFFADAERERINAFDWFGVAQDPLSGPAALPGRAAPSRGQDEEPLRARGQDQPHAGKSAKPPRIPQLRKKGLESERCATSR